MCHCTDWNMCQDTGMTVDCLRAGDVTNCEVNPDAYSLFGVNAWCGDRSDGIAPPHSLLMVMNLSLSLTPLAFGIVFSWGAVKSLARLARGAASKIASAASTTTSSFKASSSVST